VRIAHVVGTVTLNRAHPSLAGASFKLVTPLGWDSLAREKGDSPHLCEAPSGPFRQMGTVPFFPTGRSDRRLDEIVVLDQLSAGLGSRIAISEGREAAMPFHPEVKPIDAYNAAILDTLNYDLS
jgi:ethanolamine utilization protein EutN